MIKGYYIQGDVYEVENGEIVAMNGCACGKQYEDDLARAMEEAAAEAVYQHQVEASKAFGYYEDEEDWVDFEDVDPEELVVALLTFED